MVKLTTNTQALPRYLVDPATGLPSSGGGSQTQPSVVTPAYFANAQVIETVVSAAAGASSTLRPANAKRVAVEIQPDGSAIVGISLKGTAIASAVAAPTIIPTGAYPLYIPPAAPVTAITYFTDTAQTIRVREWIAA